MKDLTTKGYFTEIFGVIMSLLKGMSLTLRTMIKPAVTIHYPTEKLVPYDGFRGALLFDPARCTACGLCAKACPSACIELQHQVNDLGKRVPKIEWYTIDFGKCHFCRLCQEACPSKPATVWHSLDYELTFSSRAEMVRCWKPGFGVFGRYYDPDRKDFVEPREQVSIQSVPGHP